MNFLKYFKYCLLGFFGVFCALSTFAVPAHPGIITVTQADGSPLRIKIIGDEFMHFTVTEQGDLLFEEKNGFFSYAKVNDDGTVTSSGVLVNSGDPNGVATNIKDIDVKKIAEKRGVNDFRNRKAFSASESTGPNKAPQTGYGLASKNYPRTGSPKGLIIVVRFSDVDFTLPNPEQYFNDLINKRGFSDYNATGSALDYFTEQSQGLFTPDFDVLGPVTLPSPRSFYGGNGPSGSDQNPHLMVVHAIGLLDAEVDFNQYDTDGDGVIDNVYVFYAGGGEADGGGADCVWPHAWDVRYGRVNLYVDDVEVGPYACSNEWSTYTRMPDGIGTFVHEFSHVMGLPDLYDTQYVFNGTPGTYSVIDGGCYNNNSRTPPNYGAFERNALGWAEPIMLDSPMTVTLDPISEGQFGLIPTGKDTEFFLLENRQWEGWDEYIPYHGMLIWQVDYDPYIFDYNIVNNDANHPRVNIVKANNWPDNTSYTALSGWPFPGAFYYTDFTADTFPALQTWDNTPIDLPITDIDETDGKISFNVAGGSAGVDEIIVDNNAETEYYNLQGIKIDKPVRGAVVIERRGSFVKKVKI